MKSIVRPSLALALLSAPALLLAVGCGSSSSPTAARNVYVIQAASTNSVETDSILVFPTTATGVSTPASTLNMPSGFYAYSVATGPTGKIYVGGENGENPPQILVYAAGASGAATPVTTYTGGSSGTFDFPDFMAVNDKGQLFVMADDETIEGFAANAAANAAPTQYITTYQTNDTFSYGIGADSAGNIYVSDLEAGEINVFAAGATGAATPSRTITGTNSNTLGYLFGITADADGNVMVASYNPSDDPFESVHAKFTHPTALKFHLRHDRAALLQHVNAHPDTPPTMAPTGLYVFAADATGTATPASAISGSNTTVNEPESMTADALDNIYYVDFEDGTLTFMSFKAGDTGNVAPTTSATSAAYTHGNWLDIIAAY